MLLLISKRPSFLSEKLIARPNHGLEQSDGRMSQFYRVKPQQQTFYTLAIMSTYGFGQGNSYDSALPKLWAVLSQEVMPMSPLSMELGPSRGLNKVTVVKICKCLKSLQEDKQRNPYPGHLADN